MLAVLTACFALVIAVGALGAVALLTSRLSARARGWDFRLSEHRAAMNLFEQRIEKTSNATLRAEVDDLRGALDVLRGSHRKELGALWGRLGGKPNGRVLDGETGQPLSSGEELAAMIALQNAAPVRPE